MAARNLLHPIRPLSRAFVIAGILAMWIAPAASAVTIDWVPVGNPGNAPDTASNCLSVANCGQVNYNYYIAKYDVTNTQYAKFLNAVAASDPYALYNPSMASDGRNGGITRSGSSGSYTYAVKAGFENKPVVYVSLYTGLRFANWLNNGQGSASTETGAYTLLGGTPTPSNGPTVTRNPHAYIFLPSENEWYKAAYYNPATSSYFAYPAGSNTPTVCAAPGATANTANCFPAGPNQVTVGGSYTNSLSPYGLFDAGGNVNQWNDTIVLGNWYIRGGGFDNPESQLAASTPNNLDPKLEISNVGFRVASLVTSLIDTDGDGIPDQIDNCPFTPNGSKLGTCLGDFSQGQILCVVNGDCVSGKCSLNQEDTGGIGTGSAPDGIGDACQCGDADNNGIVNDSDASLIKRSFVNLPPFPGGVTTLPGYNKCDVNANGTCDDNDATIIERAVVDLPPGIQQKCHAATTFP